ncbi:T9SS type A sorting domain-containing protein [Flavobacterium sp.]|uniref:Ig-like domain-containing protein n=1 Tax=Flavobacterium sp. TaxID=239 RepID=UPI00261CD6D5|nr:T9SS type A sorting domain-containing protein [Flavobacterium sp.]
MKKIIVLITVCSQLVWAQNRNLTAAEYFWGTIDPGFGNGTVLTAEDGAFNEAVESVIATYTNIQTTVGPVLFNIRVKDANNQWGPTFKKAVFVNDNTFTTRQIKLTKFEYFFGNFDPGEGNGTPIVAFDGALDEAVETVFRTQATWDIANGPVLFNIRSRDVNNLWGPLFKKTVFPFGANPNAQLIAEGDSIEICQGSSVTLTYNGPNGYTPTWFDGSQGNTVTFTPTQAGSFTVTATLENSTYTDAINIIFKPQPISSITPSGQVLVCGSSNFSLQANTGTGLSYQWFLNGNPITNATNATHLPTAVGSYSVRVTDAASSCSKLSNPTVLSTTFTPQPSGIVNFCGSQILSVPSGSSNSYQWRKDNVNITGANSNTYTASQPGVYTCVITNGSCSFTTVTITLNQIAATPTANATQTFNAGETLANLTVSGTNLQWYGSLTGGAPLPLNTLLVSGTTYYVSQTINGCESNRLAITVNQALDNSSFDLNNFYLFPNPTNGILNFKSSKIINEIKIYNLLGQLVLEEFPNANEGAFSISKLPTSTYLVKVNNNPKAFSIIKN